MSLLNRLRRELQVLLDYDAVIGDQVEEGIVEKVSEPTSGEVGRVHYLPHHAVIGRQIKKYSELFMMRPVSQTELIH